MFIDLDNFKQVNDTLGHPVGDLLLRAVAERLKDEFNERDLVGRFGGDEFVVLMPAGGSLSGLEATSRSMIEKLSQPYQIGDHQIAIGASVGVAIAGPECNNVDALLRNADLALYKAKAEGRNTFRFFESELEANAQSRRNLEFDLRRALERNEFELYFQPIFSLSKEGFYGCEALLRWKHPVRGMISPALFVPVAEEMGLILRLDDWVIKHACRACAAWPEDIKVAVNVSAKHFHDRQLVDAIRRELEASKLAPHRLEVELTESALLQNMHMTRLILKELRQLGVRVSLDDFGTGYSSLSYLSSLPFNKVKIDKSFLEGAAPENRALRLLRGVTNFIADLGMLVVVEGVETEEQYKLITEFTAANEIQGYYFSKPVPHAEATALFERRKLSAA
jgi:diguanylate cyclase (GGDEF)-like protein